MAKWFCPQNLVDGADQMVQWLGKQAAVPKVLGSNPGYSKNAKLSVLGSTRGSAVLRFETGRWEVSGSHPGSAYRPSRSEFSVVFFETRLNTG